MGLQLHRTEAPESLGCQRRIDKVCAGFEAAWKSGTPPHINDYLALVSADEEHELLRELLGLDEYYRGQSGAEPSDHDYIAQHPNHAETIREYFAARVPAPTHVDGEGATKRDLPNVPGYSIERELGRGGMGVVYLALQERPRRHVVLKMIRDGSLAHPGVLRRFQMESEAIARLQHPNIVQVYGVGEHEGRPYMVLEYVAGGGLDRRLDGKPIGPRDAAYLIEQLATAVHYAHQQGVIHRDLKPANVLMSVVRGPSSVVKHQVGILDGQRTTDHGRKKSVVENQDGPSNGPWTTDYGQTKIADFGLAKLLEDDVGSLTMTGETLGTPSYMAPEQARGETQAIGPATDVFALGAILYQLLTGRPPFLGPNAVTTLEQVTGLDPVPPRQLQPPVPRDLNTICLKCLEKSPRARYVSAEDLADDLRRFLAGVPIRARAVSVAERAIRWSRRYPAAAGLIAVLFLGLAATSALLVRLEVATRNERLAKKKSDASLQNARDSVRKSLVFLVDDDELTRKGLFEFRLRVLSAITEQAEGIRAQNDDKTLMASELADAYLQIGMLQQQLGQLSKTIQSIESALNLYQMLVAREPENASIRIGLASCFLARGDYFRNEYRQSHARADYQQTLTLLRHIIAVRPDDLAAHRKLADALIASGEQEQYVKEYATAESHYRDALAAAQECTRIKPNDCQAQIAQAKSHLGIANNLGNQNRAIDEAVESVNRAGTALNAAFDAQIDDVSLRAAIATTYAQLGRKATECRLYAGAEPHLHRAITILQRLCLEFPTAQNYWFRLAEANLHLGTLYRHLGRYADEDSARQKALEHVEQMVGAGSVTLSTRIRSGTMVLIRYHIQYLRRVGKLDEAMRCIDRGQQINEVVFGPDIPRSLYDHMSAEQARENVTYVYTGWLCQFEMDRAMVHDAAGRYRESVSAWDRSMSIHSSFRTYQQIGRFLAFAGAGDFERALAQAKEIALDADLLNEHCYDLARAYSRCCHAAVPADQRTVFGQKAVEFLRQAHAKKFFDAPDQIELLTNDRDLEPLRGRADFAALLKAVNEKRPR